MRRPQTAGILSDMADLATPQHTSRITVRVPGELAVRVDALAGYCGQGRSGFIRTCIALTEATMALADLTALEGHGPLSMEHGHATSVARPGTTAASGSLPAVQPVARRSRRCR